jgi:hypothetical protein
MFSINYGLVDYVDRSTHQETLEHHPNPVRYGYLKDALMYGADKEMRVTLAAPGIGHFQLANGTLMEFPNSFPLHFDFRAAFMAGVIRNLESSPDCDRARVAEQMLVHQLDCRWP